MKIKTPLWIPLMLLAMTLASGCQAMPAAQTVSAQSNPEALLEVQPTLTARPSPTLQPTVQPMPTQGSDQARGQAAAQAAQAYFTAVSEGKTEAAADLLSSFSLMVFQVTRGDAADALQTQKIAGVRWSDLKILEVQPFDEQTLLVHVTYTEKSKAQFTPTPAKATALKTTATPTTAAKATSTPTGQPGSAAKAEANTPATSGNTVDALWPMRLERGEWRYNWNNVIDFRTLEAEAQTVNGVTVMPTQLTRYSDRLQLSMLVQNRTNDAVVFGQVNETLGTFYFGDKPVVAEKTRWILNPLRSVPAATLEIKGLFTSLPDTIEIRKWNNYNVKPWFVFQLQ